MAVGIEIKSAINNSTIISNEHPPKMFYIGRATFISTYDWYGSTIYWYDIPNTSAYSLLVAPYIFVYVPYGYYINTSNVIYDSNRGNYVVQILITPNIAPEIYCCIMTSSVPVGNATHGLRLYNSTGGLIWDASGLPIVAPFHIAELAASNYSTATIPYRNKVAVSTYHSGEYEVLGTTVEDIYYRRVVMLDATTVGIIQIHGKHYVHSYSSQVYKCGYWLNLPLTLNGYRTSNISLAFLDCSFYD